MVKYENDCVDCGQPCLGNGCPYYKVPYLYCDSCGDETDTLYYGANGDELCEHCILEQLEKVRI